MMHCRYFDIELCYSDTNSGWWATPLPSKICAQSDPPHLKKCQLRQIWQIVSAVRVSEKSSIMTNRKSTTGFSTSYRWSVLRTLPLSPPKGGSFFWIKLNFNWTKSATKFLCVKTSSGKVVEQSVTYEITENIGWKVFRSTWDIGLNCPTPLLHQRACDRGVTTVLPNDVTSKNRVWTTSQWTFRT